MDIKGKTVYVTRKVRDIKYSMEPRGKKKVEVIVKVHMGEVYMKVMKDKVEVYMNDMVQVMVMTENAVVLWWYSGDRKGWAQNDGDAKGPDRKKW